uniref:Chitin-binding type-2 domain-containing protein n=1 Tax=Daphnia galeata TaxID=27404 RepID=A0A8J2WMZ2_9CRUS|nr:unnamed protein product [Daphnia galeata]
MKITLPLAFLLFAVLMATVPGSLAAPEGTCPEIDVTTVYLPDNEQCEWFYICSNGNPIRQSCPPGMDWNRYINICDYPGNAKCPIH